MPTLKKKNGKREILLLKDLVKEFLHENLLTQRLNIIFLKNYGQNADVIIKNVLFVLKTF